MKRFTKFDDYILDHPAWRAELEILRELLLKNRHIIETIKWGAPVYTVNGKNVVGLGAFKAYVGLWFYQGVYLKDPKKVLINAQEGKTIAMRQWRFNSIKDIDIDEVRVYVSEAIENQRQGKEYKPKRNSEIVYVKEFKEALAIDSQLEAAFTMLTFFKQKEFAEYIETAKREATKLSRIEKIKPMILAGIGLNDKYREP